ncbi:hypothetical protein [Candidatus Propionivibrio aalborgensis]|nr:hypothetical protein [Candidatus Propionivibrio aalborgensis]
MRTIEAETMTDTTVITRDESTPVATVGNYEPVRLNALKHGILSRLAVLGHEDHAEFDDLLAALIDEHRPGVITERLLIEELATIIWRKRRVLLAEGAQINQGLKSAANSSKTVMASAAPFQKSMASESTDVRDLLDLAPNDVAERQQNAALNLAATRKAAAILRHGGRNAYGKARRALLPGSSDCWDEQIEEEEYPATAEGLAKFIREMLEPICLQMDREARFTPAIKAQTLGEGLQAHRLEKLNRYETHLDRKFERSLAMLLKLKQLRGA